MLDCFLQHFQGGVDHCVQSVTLSGHCVVLLHCSLCCFVQFCVNADFVFFLCAIFCIVENCIVRLIVCSAFVCVHSRQQRSCNQCAQYIVYSIQYAQYIHSILLVAGSCNQWKQIKAVRASTLPSIVPPAFSAHPTISCLFPLSVVFHIFP